MNGAAARSTEEPSLPPHLRAAPYLRLGSEQGLRGGAVSGAPAGSAGEAAAKPGEETLGRHLRAFCSAQSQAGIGLEWSGVEQAAAALGKADAALPPPRAAAGEWETPQALRPGEGRGLGPTPTDVAFNSCKTGWGWELRKERSLDGLSATS